MAGFPGRTSARPGPASTTAALTRPAEATNRIESHTGANDRPSRARDRAREDRLTEPAGPEGTALRIT